MKVKISIFILFSVFLVTGQNRYSEIKYSFEINNGSKPIILDCALLYNLTSNESSFINFGFKTKSDMPLQSKTEKNDVNGDLFVNIEEYNDGYGQNPEYQKNFAQDSLISHESIYGEKEYYLIKEKLPSMHWEILNDTLTILNKKTQNASLRFRGRQYVAWFTTDIQISDGPYKFHGLPGLILKIESIDKKYSFEAYSIKLNIANDNFSVLNLKAKYPKKKPLSIKEKISFENKNINKEIKFRMSNNPNTAEVKIEHSGIELNFDDIERN